MVDLLIILAVCFSPFVLAALVIEGYLNMRDRYMARKRDEAVRSRELIDEARLILRNPDAFTDADVAEAKRVLNDANVVPFKRRAA